MIFDPEQTDEYSESSRSTFELGVAASILWLAAYKALDP